MAAIADVLIVDDAVVAVVRGLWALCEKKRQSGVAGANIWGQVDLYIQILVLSLTSVTLVKQAI